MKITQVLKAAATAGALALFMGSTALGVTLNLGNGSEPGSLDPHKVSGDWENRVVSEYLEGLVVEDPQAAPVPGQAESWTISDDGLVYTFKLRANAQWSDGVPVTSTCPVGASLTFATGAVGALLTVSAVPSPSV